MNLPEKLRSGPFPNRAGLSSSTEMDKGSDKSKHLGNRCEEERRTNPPIQGIQTGDPRLFGGLPITDGRFSGATRGACIGHVSPEAAAGGPIAFVEEGDTICIDIPNQLLEMEVPDAVLAKRRVKWKPRPPKIDYGYLARYAAQVTSADTGAVFKKPAL